MKRVILSSTDVNVGRISTMLLDAYIQSGEEDGWTEADMQDQGDAFYVDDNGYRQECAQFICDHYDASQIVSINITVEESELVIQLCYEDSEMGLITAWYSSGRFDFSIDR